MFTLRTNAECLAHPCEPVVASFRLIAAPAAGNEVGLEVLTTQNPRPHMIEGQFLNLVSRSTVGTFAFPAFLDCLSPKSLRIAAAHGD